MGYSRQGLFSTGDAASGDLQDPAVWVDCAAEPTSVLMSYFFWGMSNQFRKMAERLFTFNSFKALLVKLFATTGGTYVDLQGWFLEPIRRPHRSEWKCRGLQALLGKIPGTIQA